MLAEAMDSASTVVFRQSSDLSIRQGNAAVTLNMVPVELPMAMVIFFIQAAEAGAFPAMEEGSPEIIMTLLPKLVIPFMKLEQRLPACRPSLAVMVWWCLPSAINQPSPLTLLRFITMFD